MCGILPWRRGGVEYVRRINMLRNGLLKWDARWRRLRQARGIGWELVDERRLTLEMKWNGRMLDVMRMRDGLRVWGHGD